MKEQNNTTQCKSSNYSMENMEKPEISEEDGGVWDKTKEGVAKAWSVTKDGAVKVWDKTKEVTEDITGIGKSDKDETAYFEEDNFTDEHGHNIHHLHGFSENDEDFASFSETDGEIIKPDGMNHLHSSSSSKQHSSQARR